jgi:hypothetical protein
MKKLDDKSFHASFLSSENFENKLYLIYFPIKCQVPVLGLASWPGGIGPGRKPI